MCDERPVILNLNLSASDAHRLLEAMKRVVRCAAGGESVNDACILREYQQRIFNGFVRICPDRPYTATQLDVDTLLAAVDAKLPKIGAVQIETLREVAMRWFQDYGDPLGGRGTRWHLTREYTHDDNLYDVLAGIPGFAEAHQEFVRGRERNRSKDGGDK